MSPPNLSDLHVWLSACFSSSVSTLYSMSILSFTPGLGCYPTPLQMSPYDKYYTSTLDVTLCLRHAMLDVTLCQDVNQGQKLLYMGIKTVVLSTKVPCRDSWRVWVSWWKSLLGGGRSTDSAKEKIHQEPFISGILYPLTYFWYLVLFTLTFQSLKWVKNRLSIYTLSKPVLSLPGFCLLFLSLLILVGLVPHALGLRWGHAFLGILSKAKTDVPLTCGWMFASDMCACRCVCDSMYDCVNVQMC